MKIFQINSTFDSGSTGRIVASIHNFIKKAGEEGFIAFGRGRLSYDQNNIFKIGNLIEIYLHGLKTRLLDKHAFGSRIATQELLKLINIISPDIIHIHNLHGYYINIKILLEFIKFSNIPVICTAHDCWLFTGHCTHFNYVNCDRWKSECFDCPQKKRYPKSLLFDNSKRIFKLKKALLIGINNMTIVTPSLWLAKLVKESYLKDYPVEVINNGIDLEIFKPKTSTFRKLFGLNNKFIILGVASVWEERKGLQYFIELTKFLENDEVIVLVGLDYRQLERIPKGMILIKKTESPDELAEIYDAADVFVNCTLEDNFPTVNLEALACGTPVVTFDSGGAVETVDHNCGFIVEKGNIGQLVEKIRIIKKNGKWSYSDYCLDRAKKYYSDKIMATKYLELYKRILKEYLIDKRISKCKE